MKYHIFATLMTDKDIVEELKSLYDPAVYTFGLADFYFFWINDSVADPTSGTARWFDFARNTVS